jgi:hypothetical protein
MPGSPNETYDVWSEPPPGYQSGDQIAQHMIYADAVLISAAPDMAEALKEAQRELLILDREMRGIAPEAISHALPLIRVALAKAGL